MTPGQVELAIRQLAVHKGSVIRNQLNKKLNKSVDPGQAMFDQITHVQQLETGSSWRQVTSFQLREEPEDHQL